MNLGLNVRREEESSDTVPAGSVTRTGSRSPRPSCRRARSVTVYVSLGSGKMPELKNQSKENAKSILDAMNLICASPISRRRATISHPAMSRAPSLPRTASSAAARQVTVYVSKGSGKVTVPPVTGLSVRDAHRSADGKRPEI